MDREWIKSLGSQPLNGNDAYAALEVVFEWLEETKHWVGTQPSELENKLREAGYYYEKVEGVCPYSQPHKWDFCRYDGCRES